MAPWHPPRPRLGFFHPPLISNEASQGLQWQFDGIPLRPEARILRTPTSHGVFAHPRTASFAKIRFRIRHGIQALNGRIQEKNRGAPVDQGRPSIHRHPGTRPCRKGTAVRSPVHHHPCARRPTLCGQRPFLSIPFQPQAFHRKRVSLSIPQGEQGDVFSMGCPHRRRWVRVNG